MQVTLAVAFALFKQANPECKIGFTKFTTLRPKNVRLLTVKHWNFCVCTVCQNISYKLRVISKHLKKIKDFDHLLDIVLCPKNDAQRFHSSSCIFQKCDKFFDTKKRLHAYFANDNDEVNKQNERLVTWNHWERVVEDGKARKVLKTKSGAASVMLEEFLTDIMKPVQSKTFPEHLFTGQWQQRQFAEIKTDLPKDCVLLIMDFGINRTIRYQDEPKSVYYTTQVTIHPVVLFYHSSEVDQLTVRESLVFLSDDLSHDSHAVNHFLEQTLDYLTAAEIPLKKVIVFSDGCASQYKGKGTFAYLSLKNVHIEWNYFGSDHGKSESDGEVGSINRAVDNAILGRKAIICKAEDMFAWCSESSLCLDEPGSKRKFFLVKKGDIKRGNKMTDVQTLQGTRKIHQTSNVPGEPYELLVKKLSCYCSFCRNNEPEHCVNTEFTGAYEEKTLLESKSIAIKLMTRSTANATSMHENEVQQTPEQSCATETVTTVSMKTTDSFAYWNKLTKCKTYTDVYQASVETELPCLQSLPEVTFGTHKRIVDNSALKLLPDEVQQCGLLPTTIYGDGNCLPRCGSVLAYGNEENNIDIRARIILESVINEQKYLEEGSEVSLSKTNFAKQFAMFSEHYSGEELTDLAIQRLFRAEVLSLCRSGTFMGCWQIAALANILQTDVVSVYPQYGGQTVRGDINRSFVPFEKKEINNEKVYIMWSNLSGNDVPENLWRPNHFVVLLKMYPDRKELVEVENDCREEQSPLAFFDDSDDDLMNSSLISGIIHDLDVEEKSAEPVDLVQPWNSPSPSPSSHTMSTPHARRRTWTNQCLC